MNVQNARVLCDMGICAHGSVFGARQEETHTSPRHNTQLSTPQHQSTKRPSHTLSTTHAQRTHSTRHGTRHDTRHDTHPHTHHAPHHTTTHTTHNTLHTHTHSRTPTRNNTSQHTETDKQRERKWTERERRVKCDKHCELQQSCFFYMSGYTHKTEVHVC